MEHIITSIKGPVLALASKFAAKQEDTTSSVLCQFTNKRIIGLSMAKYKVGDIFINHNDPNFKEILDLVYKS